MRILWDSDGTACAATMFEGHFLFLTDNPGKAVSVWLRRWSHEVLYVGAGWNQDQECRQYRQQKFSSVVRH